MSENKHEQSNEQSGASPSEDIIVEQAPSEQNVDTIAVLEAEKADLKDKLLRLLADMENLRRRTAKEVSDARAYGITGFAKDMLTVADNIRRALEAAPKELIEAADPAIKSVIEGVELTERDFLNSLDRHGVRKLEPLNQKFDPNFHQAMFEVPDPSIPSGTVVQVVQTGFAIGDRVLRPALVGVSKGGAKATAPAETADAEAHAPKQ